jgi:putative endonuclease
MQTSIAASESQTKQSLSGFAIRIPLPPPSPQMRAFFMGYSVYILYSEGHDSYYIGQTQDVQERVRRHNAKLEAATSRYAPWVLVLAIQKEDRAQAVALEKKLKNLNRQKLLTFIQKYKNS